MQKRRQRKRLRLVDNVVATLNKALGRQGMSTKNLERWNHEMPKEEEMLAKDKYTIFDRKEKKYRKGIHSQSTLGCVKHVVTRSTDHDKELPKWTRVSQRLNPPGF